MNTRENTGSQRSSAVAPLLAVTALALHSNGVSLTPAGLKGALREMIARDPMDALAVTVLGGSFLFFLAERGANPKVTSYFDALVFISTSLSVGYADVFARTPEGKAIATALMTLGPAMSGAALEPPAREQVDVQRAILDKLDAILVELRKGA